MTDLNLSEGQEFYIGGQRYVVKDGVPVQEAKRGPLGGELVKFGDLNIGDRCFVGVEKTTSDSACCLGEFLGLCLPDYLSVEINVPQPQQAKGRVMTAGEAAKLPDIVGKLVMVKGVVFDTDDEGEPLCVRFGSGLTDWLDADDKIEVLD